MSVPNELPVPEEPGEEPGVASLGPGSRLTLRPFSVVPQGEEFLVGDRQTGVFLAFPEVGLVALRALSRGDTVAQATEVVTEHAGQDVDVLDFAGVLIESGLVTAVDGRPLGPATDAGRGRRWLQGVRAEWVRPFFSVPAWTIYGLLFAACLVLLIADPRFRPMSEDLFFYPDPAVCVVVILVASILLTVAHEAGHYLAARATGVGASFNISRRLFFPVIETDLSQLWSLPRRERYGPFLAGMAVDVIVLAACLGLRAAWVFGLVEPPALLVRLAGTIALVQILRLLWQTLVFLRTDLYAMLVTAAGCFNLYRVTELWLFRRLHLLGPEGHAELAAAHPRDVRMARWFGLLTIGGLVWAGWAFWAFFIPGTVVPARWVFASLLHAPIASRGFWEALIIGSVAAIGALAPLGILWWQRRGQDGKARVIRYRVKTWWWVTAAVLLLIGLFRVYPSPGQPARVSGLSRPVIQGPGEVVPMLTSPHLPYPQAPHVPYNSVPPTSGPHVHQTVMPGVYREDIAEEIQVHALEHGHVLVLYAPGTPVDQVRVLEGIARRHPGDVVLAPYGKLGRGIALTAWGRLARLDRPDTGLVERFVQTFARRYNHGWKATGPA